LQNKTNFSNYGKVAEDIESRFCEKRIYGNGNLDLEKVKMEYGIGLGIWVLGMCDDGGTG
jgi:hypothetical protein